MSRAVANLDGMAPNIATNTEVGLDELLDFVRPRHRMLLITERADGSPQASPVTGGVDDSGRIVIATYPQRAKTKNARQPAGASPSSSSPTSGTTRGSRSTASARCSTPARGRRRSTRSSSTSATSPASTPTGRSTARRWSTRASPCCASRRPAGAPSSTGGFPRRGRRAVLTGVRPRFTPAVTIAGMQTDRPRARLEERGAAHRWVRGRAVAARDPRRRVRPRPRCVRRPAAHARTDWSGSPSRRCCTSGSTTWSATPSRSSSSAS